MITRTICGKNISPIGLGCMGMSEFYGESDEGACLDILKKAFDLGYRHFDTADLYGRGHNEELLSQFIKTLSVSERHSVVIASKVGIVRDEHEKYKISINNDSGYIKRACDATLKRLNIECLDLYYLHRLLVRENVAEVMAVFKDLIDAGKIRGVGLCEVDSETLVKAADVVKISALQSEYSLWSREVETSCLAVCASLNIPFVAFSPLGRGFLTGSITADTKFSEETDLRSRLPRFSGENLEGNIELLNRFESIAREAAVDKSELALAWVLAKGDNIHVIPGTRREKYLISNFDSQNVNLNKKLLSELDNLFSDGAVLGSRYPAAISPPK